VLFDLAGHTAHNRLPVFAYKPAPVQATWLGYFATTGVAEIDYLLADATSVPPAHHEHFTETIWYLPDTRLCFTPPRDAPEVSPLPALRQGRVTFGSFQNLAKLNDAVFALWARVLAALPGSRLRLQNKQLADAAVREQLGRRLQQAGIAAERVALHGPAARAAYLAAHGEVDLILDTFPFPGGTTTCEALWMGVPTLTLAGDRLIGLQGASLLAAAGLNDWIAVTPDEYVDQALAFARELPALARLRGGLRARLLASPLCDAPRFARHFEAAVRAMWQRRPGRAG
jgi:predicted O-linked N-acetylglucosamine transferase (SPINDLY family)